jgi:LuxR family maltose regulon positive regulatory protein
MLMDTQTPIPILSPKLQIPPSRLQLVVRERLQEVLNRGLLRKLTLLSAPAGYGKTTLLSEWVAQCEWRIAWVTLAAEDNDTERFLAYLISAMQIAFPSLSILEGILGGRFSIQPMPLDAILAILVNQLSSTADRLVVVLDDYHLIENQEIHGFLNALLGNLPQNIHIVVSTRSDPPLRLARLRAKDQLNEITERDLRFTLEEARRFFEDVMGLHLTHDQIAELEMRTEGWVTALQLVGLSLKDRERPSELIETLAGTHRYILDYLVEEVFSDLPPLLQTFLLRVSILERLSPGLCDAVVGNLDGGPESGKPPQSKEILEYMDASNLFVVPLDTQRQWYRFHPLFADFLRDRLATQHVDELPDLHHRAATWYADHDLLSEAVQHSFAANDVGHAADLIQAQAKEMLGRGEITTLLRWIKALPEEVIDARPQLGLARAWGMLMRDPLNFWGTIDQQTNKIAEGFGIAPQDLISALAESKPDSPLRSGLGEFAMLQAFAQRDTRQANQTLTLFKAALEYLPESELLLRGFTLAGLASTYARAGAIKLAEEAFVQGAQISIAANSIYGYVACTDWQATMQAEQGQLIRAAATYRQAIETLSNQGRPPLPLSGHVYVGLASVLLEWNDLVGALENVQIGLQVGIKVRDLDALLTGYVIQARAFQALNKKEEAQEAIQNAEHQARETKSMSCVLDALAKKAQLALVYGAVEEAQRWATERGLGQSKLSELDPQLEEIEYLTYARLLMAKGIFNEALPILNELSNSQEQMGRMRAYIESLALKALCCRALNRIDEAVRTLAHSLLLAEPQGFVRVFVEQGPLMAALLRTAGSQGHSPEYVKRLLEAFGETRAPQEAILDPLSERELDVLRLVAQGLTNTEIAAELVVANSTVKTHINRIYSKLAVSTRTQAVARARQLQILP